MVDFKINLQELNIEYTLYSPRFILIPSGPFRDALAFATLHHRELLGSIIVGHQRPAEVIDYLILN
jgi:hypothetical protein